MQLDGTSGELLGVFPALPLSVGTSAPAGIAAGSGERLYATSASPIHILGPVAPPEAQVLPVTEIGQTTAKLNGKVTVPPPGGEASNTVYRFELSADGGFHWTRVPASNVPLGSTPGTFAVSQTATGLQPGVNYLVRLVAITGPTVTSGQVVFSTLGASPSVFQRYGATEVTSTSAQLAGSVNPNNSPTTYRFEYGTSTAYGSQSPAELEPFLGEGGTPISVTANLTGLQPDTTYHWHIVATNAVGTTEGPDRQFTTYEPPEGLNAAGLPHDRGVELVSPADKRPVGNVEQLAVNQVYYQATADGDRMGYFILNGVEDSPGGGEVVYSASRSSAGWSSTEISSPPLIPAPETSGGHYSGATGFVRYLDPEDLKCGLVETHNPLSADTPAADVENGVYNLYRWNASDRTYTLITNRIPLNPSAMRPLSGMYAVAGVSADCSRIFFRATTYSFFAGASGIYEWHEGTLRDAALRPDGTVPSLDPDGVAKAKNAVSPDGRYFFAAISNQGADAGKQAVFVRKSPTEVVDASQPTAGPTLGARYEGASPDGGHVYFLANYGIAATSSSGPSENCSGVLNIGNTACDLYDYDVETGQLTDVSADNNPADTKGAVVQGVMAILGGRLGRLLRRAGAARAGRRADLRREPARRRFRQRLQIRRHGLT